MALRSLPETLKLIIEQRGSSQNQFAQDVGIGQSWLSDVINGKRRNPGLAKVMELLDRVGWEVRFAPKGEESIPVKRRQFNTTFAQVAAGVAFVPTASVAPEADPGHVLALTERVRDLYCEQGSRPATSAAFRYLRLTRSAIKSRDHLLKEAVSDLAREASVVALNERGASTSAELSKAALELGRSAGSPGHQAFALMELSRVSTRGGRAADGKQYAEAGLRIPDLRGNLQAGLEVRLASSLAMLPGQERNARYAIERAHVVAEGLSRTVQSDIAGHAGIALASLGAHKDAMKSLQVAVQTTASAPMRASWLTRQGLVGLHSADPLVAVPALNHLAYVMAFVEDSAIEARVRRIYAAAAKWGDVPEVRTACERLQELVPPGPAEAR